MTPNKLVDAQILTRKAFYVMRHGQSADNALGVISGGGSDPHLTLKGYKQAEMASLQFQRLDPRPTSIVTSGLIRAHMTAKIVTGLELFQDPDLNERHLGELDGKISEEEQKARKILPGEESSADHRARVVAAINRHLNKHEIALFVCHAGTIRRILEAVNLQDQVSVGNAELYRLIPEGEGWTVL